MLNVTYILMNNELKNLLANMFILHMICFHNSANVNWVSVWNKFLLPQKKFSKSRKCCQLSRSIWNWKLFCILLAISNQILQKFRKNLENNQGIMLALEKVIKMANFWQTFDQEIDCRFFKEKVGKTEWHSAVLS